MNQTAICGSCGQSYANHHHEYDISYCNKRYISYCNTITNGDTFTDDPSAQTICRYLEDEFPKFMSGLIDLWKSEHGHGEQD